MKKLVTPYALLDPTSTLRTAFLAMLDECEAAGDDWYERYARWAREDFAGYVAHLHDRAAGRNLPPERVPDSHFWLVGAQGQLLGMSAFRHRLTPLGLRHMGHIGYHLRPSARGRGLGTALLAGTLERVRLFGLPRVLLTANATNYPSLRVIRRNGGLLADEIISPATGELICRCWIAL